MTTPAPHRATHAGWPTPLTRPAMSNTEDRHSRYALTSRYLEVDGRPAIPVSGELHYSRVPRDRWAERLGLLRSMGVTVVSTYVIWVHHEPSSGVVSFEGGLDVAAFVCEAAAAGLDVVVRIGPWAHGEVRHGGFPDWVQSAPVAHRTDDPAYLDLVRHWYALVANELAALCGPDSPIVGIQLENELVDQPEHLRTLKRLAREAGLSAPLWTATAWDGAELPEGDLLPLYGGYSDGFWVDADASWQPGFRAQFRFSHEWDDPGIGADLRPGIGRRPPRPPAEGWPIATCELGGGMATAYHRRPVPTAADLAALANVKLGSGSNWQGYYMAVGGLNPGDDLQESLATGYPNDLPRFDYDFHAPIGAAGELAPSHAALRVQHAFLGAFGERLAAMPSTLPEARPGGDDDRSTLRWALRSDGESGFVFISQHQPHEPLEDVPGVQFSLALDGGDLIWPAQPVDVPAGTIARWPFNLPIGDGGVLRWATASVVTVLPDDVPTLVLLAEPGIPVELAFEVGTVRESRPRWSSRDRQRAYRERVTDSADRPTGSRYAPDFVVRYSTSEVAQPFVVNWQREDAAFDVLVLPASEASRVWVLEGGAGRRELLISDEPLLLRDGVVVAKTVVSRTEPRVEPISAAGEPLARYGGTVGRTAAPDAETIVRLAAAYRLSDLGAAIPGFRRVLGIEWAGDVATLEIDGVTVADRFWDGTRWLVDLDAVGISDDVVLRILPLHAEAPVHLPAEASARRQAAAPEPLHALDALHLTRTRECERTTEGASAAE
jgi:hypothetical protein